LVSSPRKQAYACFEAVANLSCQDNDATVGQLSGPFDDAVLEGLKHDIAQGSQGWAGLHAQARSEDDMLAIPFTSGTTSKPKGVVYTHRGSYLATMANIVESGLNIGRCKYLWILPMLVTWKIYITVVEIQRLTNYL
jgi:long-subunit acyl-CoA synthetase (AMP-forming)